MSDSRKRKLTGTGNMDNLEIWIKNNYSLTLPFSFDVRTQASIPLVLFSYSSYKDTCLKDL